MSLLLEYPYSGAPSSTVTLTSPVMGDSRQRMIHTRYKRSMSGKLYSYKSTPATTKALWRCLALTDAQIVSLRAFLKASSGEDIKITDHLSRVWQAKILNAPLEDTDAETCKNEVTLDIEGTII
jgi:hypothetical protein